jgi:hypothetical protein
VYRSVRTFLPVVGDPHAVATAFCDDPQRWLPAARREGSDRFSFPVHAGALTRIVHATLGSPWQAGATRWRTFAWDLAPVEGDIPTIDRLLPSLDGEIGVHLEDAGRTTLVLDARYHPPGGPLGAAVDTVALHLVARRTVERFLEEVAARLASEALLVVEDEPVGREPSAADRYAPDHHGAETVGT